MDNRHSNVTYFQNITELGECLSEKIKGYSSIYVLVDSNTHEHCLPAIVRNAALGELEILEIEPGEESKSLEICHHLWTALLEMGADRNSLIINLGGGVVTDLGGFIASTYKRGIDFINIPCSLLAMVDASVGGKTGINIAHSKNQVGTFCDAKEVLICSELLGTLSDRHILSGFAEMLKHGLVADEKHWDDLSSLKELSVESLSKHIERSIAIKAETVAEDPKEAGLRKVLNFGHTIGHAIESSLMDTKGILHGEAVALGILLESRFAHQSGKLSKEDLAKIEKTIERHYPLDFLSGLEKGKLWEYMKMDKKNKGDEVQMSIICEIGTANWDVTITRAEFDKLF